jgi:hypothetical protein
MDKRTLRQNRALHLWFTQIAEALNEAGLDMKAVLKPSIDINWTATTVKEYLWRPVQKLVLDKTSTTELDKAKEIDQVFDTINRFLGERGIHVSFPSIEEIIHYEE